MNAIVRGWKLYFMMLALISQLAACGDETPAEETPCPEGTVRGKEGEGRCIPQQKDPGDGECIAATCRWQNPPPKVPCEGLEDGDECGEGKLCLDKRCIVPGCVSDEDCASEDQCIADGSCDLTRFECVAGAPLEDGDECGDGDICLDQVCITPGCTSDADCVSADQCVADGSCDLTRFECVVGGNVEAGSVCDLGEDEGLCLNGACVPGHCLSDEDCDNGKVCDGAERCADNSCVAGDPPEHGASCGDGNVCLDEACIEPECTVDADCVSDMLCFADGICDLARFECVAGAPLMNGASCGDGNVCLDEACIEPECTVDADCASTQECRADGSCDLSSFTCAPGGPLPAGTPCSAGTCDPIGFCDEPVNPHRKVCNLTGPGTSSAQYGVVATDLGIPVRQPNGQMAYIFGDTFSEACVSCGTWRSPVLLRGEPGRPQSCIEFTSAAGGATAKQIINYQQGPSTITSWLPSDAITIGSRMYLHVIGNQGLGNVIETRIAYSDDNGENWTLSDTAVWPGHINDNLRQLWTWERGDDGYVYIFSTKFISRDRQLILQRVPEDQLLNPAAYEPWGWTMETGWDWGIDATSWVHDGHYGEMSLRRIDGTWVFAYFNAGDANITVKILTNGPVSNMWEVPTYAVIEGSSWADESDTEPLRVAQPYGAYIHPDSTLNNLHLIVSQWDTRPQEEKPGEVVNWPYRAMHFHVSVPKP